MNKCFFSSVELLKTTATFALFTAFTFQASAMNSNENLNRSGFAPHYKQLTQSKDEKTVQNLLTNVYNYHAGNGAKQLVDLGTGEKKHILETATSLVLKGVYEKPDTTPLIHAWEVVTGKGWGQEKSTQNLLTNVYNYHTGHGVKQLVSLGEREKGQILETATALVLKGMYEKPDTLPIIHAWEGFTGKGWAQEKSTQGLLANVYNYHAGKGIKQFANLNAKEKGQVIETATSLVLKKLYKDPDTTPLIRAWEIVMKESWTHQQTVMQQFMQLPLVKQARERTCFDDKGDDYQENFVICDLGHKGRARTEQYRDPINVDKTLNALNLPAALIFHPYEPADGLNTCLGPAYFLNVKLPAGYSIDLDLPEALRANLVGVERENIEVFIEFQDMPWEQQLQLKPQYVFEPNAPTVSATKYGGPEHTYIVRAGVFSRDNPNIRIQGQPFGGLLLEPRISIHNAGPNTPLVSSDAVLNIVNLDANASQVVHSLVRYADKITGVEKAAIGIHGLLNKADGVAFNAILQASNNLTEVKNWVQARKIVGDFAGLNLGEVF